MTLKEIRTKFIQLSGRFDLVVDLVDYADAGADFYINAGVRWLQKKLDLPYVFSRVYSSVVAGTWYIDQIGQVRAIECVWVSNSEARWKLARKELGELWSYYDQPITDIDRAAPRFFAPNISRAVDDTDKDDVASFFDWVGAAPSSTDSIIFLPPCDEAVVVEVWGHFETVELSSDNDTNYFLEKYPDTVVYAALMKLETAYRNTTGARDWLLALEMDIDLIDKDIVTQEYANITQPTG